MKVLYISHRPNLTGSSRSLLDLLAGLDRTKVEPVVLVNRKGPMLEELDKLNIPYEFAPLVPSLNADNPVLDFVKRALNAPPLYWLSLAGVKRKIKQIHPDIVHNNNLLTTVGMRAAKELGIPYVCHYRDFLWEDHHRKLVREKKDHKLMKAATVNLFISDAVKAKFAPFAEDHMVVIRDGIHVDNYLLPKREVLAGDTVTLLLAGRLHPNKGQLDAVKAVELARKKMDKDLRLIILGTVGDEPFAEELHAYVDDNHLEFVSIQPFTNDLKELRSKCDIGLTCSTLEGLGRVTIENMLSSLLVIASASGGTLEIVEDRKTGMLYETGNVEDLANKILEAITNAEQSNQIAQNGHDYAMKEFDHKAYTEKVQALYESIV